MAHYIFSTISQAKSFIKRNNKKYTSKSYWNTIDDAGNGYGEDHKLNLLITTENKKLVAKVVHTIYQMQSGDYGCHVNKTIGIVLR